jgi:hypothetical protein
MSNQIKPKALIFDSSSIITLALNNLLGMLVSLKAAFGGRFFITPKVKEEMIDVPLRIKRFELEALMISSLVENKILEIAELPELDAETEKVYTQANSAFKAGSEWIKVFHYGESSCIALANLLSQNYKICLVVDERTTRMLCEAPQNLQKLLERKLHTKIFIENSRLQYFKDIFKSFKIIRSSELCFIAFSKKLIVLPAPAETALDALLYATKFKGCAISVSEIEKVKTNFRNF